MKSRKHRLKKMSLAQNARFRCVYIECSRNYRLENLVEYLKITKENNKDELEQAT